MRTSPSTSRLVSVIVPVYNVAKLLERCIKSIFAQTYKNLEIILIDDGSTDMSGKFCDAYTKLDPRVRVIHQSNQGLSAARNAGLKIARGQFLTFVDSDDSIEPTLVEHLLDLCVKNHTKMSICSFTETSEPPNNPQNLPPPHTETLSTLDCLTRMLCEDGFSMSAWGKLYSRDLFRDVKFPTGRLYEDVGTIYQLVIQCPKIAVSSAKLYNYYINPTSITKQPFSLKKLDLIDLTDKMCDDLTAWSKTQPASTQSDIEFLTQKRRMHARFSILRQMVLTPLPPKSSPIDRKSYLTARRVVVRYLRQHKSYILRNPLASRRDRFALRSLQLGLPVFRRAWQIYTKNYRNQP